MDVALSLKPVLPVPVGAVGAAAKLGTPATQQICLQWVGVCWRQARVALLVHVTSLQGPEDDGCLVLDLLVFHVEPVVFIDCLPPCNCGGEEGMNRVRLKGKLTVDGPVYYIGIGEAYFNWMVIILQKDINSVFSNASPLSI